MWIPKSEAEIIDALEAGSVRETAALDAKQQLPTPGKNRDLARDLCAMTVDGGALLYGVGGQDGTRPNTPTPFDLAGAAERIDQVAQTAISEPPLIEIDSVSSTRLPGCGYLTVLIPASPRAPHMVVADGDSRYYGRGATGNRILTEGEVARLYARRERRDQDGEQLLDEVVAAMPFSFTDPLEQVGPILVVTRALGGAGGSSRSRLERPRSHAFLADDVHGACSSGRPISRPWQRPRRSTPDHPQGLECVGTLSPA